MANPLKTLQDILPFLDAYPLWVRTIVGLWVLATAIVIFVLILTPRTRIPDAKAEVRPVPSSTPAARGEIEKPKSPSPQMDAVPQAVASTASTESPPPRSPVTLPDLLNTLNAKNLTDLQKQAFRDKHRGKIVEWRAYVVSVTPEDSYSGEILAMFSAHEPGARLPGDLVPAWFGRSHKSDLLDLAAGDLITILGILDFKLGNASLRDASILHHEKTGRVT